MPGTQSSAESTMEHTHAQPSKRFKITSGEATRDSHTNPHITNRASDLPVVRHLKALYLLTQQLGRVEAGATHAVGLCIWFLNRLQISDDLP